MAINLTKGQKIDLTKKDASGATAQIKSFCVGANWGVIEKKGIFGTKKIAVDLDASCAVFNANNELIDVVFFNQLRSRDGAIQHSGDDLVGDVDGDDGLDNEIISVNLNAVDPQAHQIVFFLNSFNQQDFATVPFAAIRLYEGTPSRVDNVVATYDIATGAEFRGMVALVMGKLYRRNNEWKFSAIGEPSRDKGIKETLQTIVSGYL